MRLIPMQSLKRGCSPPHAKARAIATTDRLGATSPTSVGCAVLVPFGHRRAVGFVVSIGEYGQPGGPQWPQGIDAGKLKAIERAVSQPYFDEEGAAVRPMAFRTLYRAAVGVRAPVHAARRRAAHGARARWRLAPRAAGSRPGGRSLGGRGPGIFRVHASCERRQAGRGHGSVARRAAARE